MLDPHAKQQYERSESQEVWRMVQSIKETNEWNTHGLPVAQPAKTIGLLFVALPQLTEGYTYLESPVSERPTLQDAEDVVKKGVETVKDKAVGAKEKVKSGLSSVEDTIEKNIEPVKEKAADWIGHAEEVVSEKVSEFIQGANDTASKIESAITDKEKTVKDKIKSTVDDVKSKVKDVKSKVEDIKNAARERIHEATRPRKPEVVEHYAEPTGEPVEEPITVEPVVTITEPTVEPLPLEEEPVTVKEVPVHHTHQVGFLDTVKTILAAPAFLVELVFTFIMELFGLSTVVRV